MGERRYDAIQRALDEGELERAADMLAKASRRDEDSSHLALLEAELAQERDEREEAKRLFARAIEVAEGHSERSEPVAEAQNSYGVFLAICGEREAAERALNTALSIRRERLGEDHPSVALVIGNLGFLEQRLGRFDESEPLLLRALEGTPEGHPNFPSLSNNVGMLYEETGRHREAAPHLSAALRAHESRCGRRSIRLVAALANLALNHERRGLATDAEAYYRRALAIHEAHFDQRVERHMNCACAFAQFLEARGEAEAESWYRRTLGVGGCTERLREDSVVELALEQLVCLYAKESQSVPPPWRSIVAAALGEGPAADVVDTLGHSLGPREPTHRTSTDDPPGAQGRSGVGLFARLRAAARVPRDLLVNMVHANRFAKAHALNVAARRCLDGGRPRDARGILRLGLPRVDALADTFGATRVRTDFGHHAARLGEWEEAGRLYRQASRSSAASALSPLAPLRVVPLIGELLASFARGEDETDRLVRDAGLADAHAGVLLGLAAALRGRWADARSHLERALRDLDADEAPVARALYAAALHHVDPDASAVVYRELLEGRLDPRTRATLTLRLAHLLAAHLGKKKEALEEVERALALCESASVRLPDVDLEEHAKVARRVHGTRAAKQLRKRIQALSAP